MSRLFYVFLGGGAGSVARYLVTIVAARFISAEFPFGTLIVNVIGCFLIGFVNGAAMLSARVSPDARLFMTAGVLGGFTTYSAFNYETLALFEQGQVARATGYLAVTIIACALAGVLGASSARAMLEVM